MSTLRLFAILAAAVPLLPCLAHDEVLVSVAPSGLSANGPSNRPVVSADGRYVVFESAATDLVPGDTNNLADVFRRDMLAGQTLRVNLTIAGAQMPTVSDLRSCTPDGRYVVFDCQPTIPQLVPAATYVWDAQTGQTSIESKTSEGVAVFASFGQLSDDGRYIVFTTQAAGVPDDGNGVNDVYFRDRQLDTIERISVSTAGVGGDSFSTLDTAHCLSADGRYVIFDSYASNLDTDVPVPFNEGHVFLRDRVASTTRLIDKTPAGAPAAGYSHSAGISADGHFAVFTTRASNLLPDSNGIGEDVIVCDLQTGALELANVSALGVQGAEWCFNPSLSADGRFVVFETQAANLNPLDAVPTLANDYDVFVRDRLCGLTQLGSVHLPNSYSGSLWSLFGDLSRDGTHLAFQSQFAFVMQDTNQIGEDVYLKDLVAGSPWKDLGHGLPGTLGVPVLAGQGEWPLASQGFIGLGRVAPGSPVMLIVGAAVLDAPFKGGVLVPVAQVLIPLVMGNGPLTLPANSPAGVPHGTSFYLQAWITDPAGPKGFAASNGLKVTVGG